MVCVDAHAEPPKVNLYRDDNNGNLQGLVHQPVFRRDRGVDEEQRL